MKKMGRKSRRVNSEARSDTRKLKINLVMGEIWYGQRKKVRTGIQINKQ